MQRYITLGDGRKIGLGKYVAAWKACKALPPNTPIGKGVTGWGRAINNPRLIVRWLPADMMKIPRFAERVAEGRAC